MKTIKETSLSGNQEKSEMKRLSWRVEGDNSNEGNGNEKGAIRGGVVDSSTLIVELGPMEIRTFLFNFF